MRTGRLSAPPVRRVASASGDTGGASFAKEPLPSLTPWRPEPTCRGSRSHHMRRRGWTGGGDWAPSGSGWVWATPLPLWPPPSRSSATAPSGSADHRTPRCARRRSCWTRPPGCTSLPASSTSGSQTRTNWPTPITASRRDARVASCSGSGQATARRARSGCARSTRCPATSTSSTGTGCPCRPGCSRRSARACSRWRPSAARVRIRTSRCRSRRGRRVRSSAPTRWWHPSRPSCSTPIPTRRGAAPAPSCAAT